MLPPTQVSATSGGNMTTYGFKISVLEITKPQFPSQPYQMDDGAFGDEGALGFLESRIGALLARGQVDERTGVYVRIISNTRSNRGLLVVGASGTYGSERPTEDRRNGRPGPTLDPDHVVLAPLKVVLLVPEYGHQIVMVSEVHGRSHLTSGLVKQLNNSIRSLGFTIRVRRDVADGLAWARFLDDPDSGIIGIQLASKSVGVDGVPLVSGRGVTNLDLRLGLDPNSSEARSIGERLKRIFGAAGRAQGPQQFDQISLAQIVGLQDYGEGEFDDEKVVVVENGRERKINVSRGLPSFVYPIEADAPPDVPTLRSHAEPVAQELFDDLDIDLPTKWWPTEN